MAYSSIINLPELLAVEKTLYPTLFVSRLWYKCGTPILWKRIELKENEAEDKSRLEDL
jgi:hypothetical protein